MSLKNKIKKRKYVERGKLEYTPRGNWVIPFNNSLNFTIKLFIDIENIWWFVSEAL